MENWEIVRIVTSEEEATLVAGFLRSNDIPAEVESLVPSEFPVTVGGEMGEVRVQVPTERLAEARALLDRQDAEAAAGAAAAQAPPAAEPGTAPAEPGPALAEPSVVEPE